MAKRNADQIADVFDHASPASTSTTLESFSTPGTLYQDSPSKSPLRKNQKIDWIPAFAHQSVEEDKPASTNANETEVKDPTVSIPNVKTTDAQITGDGLSSDNKSEIAIEKPATENTNVVAPQLTSDELSSNNKSKKASKKPATKKKRPTTSTRRPAKAKVATGPPPAPKPKRINKVVAAKVKAVGDFLDATPATESVLRRASDNVDHVVVTELAAISAVKAMLVDYDISNPSWASLMDIKDIIIDEFVESLGENPAVRFTTLDLSKTSAFEEAIHQKIAGWELEDINLLEAELEINARALESAAADSPLRHMMEE